MDRNHTEQKPKRWLTEDIKLIDVMESGFRGTLTFFSENPAVWDPQPEVRVSLSCLKSCLAALTRRHLFLSRWDWCGIKIKARGGRGQTYITPTTQGMRKHPRKHCRYEQRRILSHDLGCFERSTRAACPWSEIKAAGPERSVLSFSKNLRLKDLSEFKGAFGGLDLHSVIEAQLTPFLSF